MEVWSNFYDKTSILSILFYLTCYVLIKTGTSYLNFYQPTFEQDYQIFFANHQMWQQLGT